MSLYLSKLKHLNSLLPSEEVFDELFDLEFEKAHENKANQADSFFINSHFKEKLEAIERLEKIESRELTRKLNKFLKCKEK